MTSKSANRAILLTPPGVGAIGVIRVLGPDAVSIVEEVLQSQSGQPLSAPPGNRLRYGRFSQCGQTVDDVVVSAAPSTNPPAVDICAHGGVRIMERILQALEQLGASVWDEGDPPPPIWPVANLIEEEAVAAMSRAKTQRAVRFAAAQRRDLVTALMRVASWCCSDVTRARGALDSMLDGFRAGRTLIEGATVAIVGPPNSGKSTLFNHLLGRSATIVSPHAGTTRDWVTEPVEMEGVPLVLVDTAGRRGAADARKREVIEDGFELSEAAHVRLLLLDGSRPLPDDVGALPGQGRYSGSCLTVINKLDQGRAWEVQTLPTELAGCRTDPVGISAKTGVGVDRLIHRILGVLGFDGWVDTQPSLFTARQSTIAAEILSSGIDSPADGASVIRCRLIGWRSAESGHQPPVTG